MYWHSRKNILTFTDNLLTITYKCTDIHAKIYWRSRTIYWQSHICIDIHAKIYWRSRTIYWHSHKCTDIHAKIYWHSLWRSHINLLTFTQKYTDIHRQFTDIRSNIYWHLKTTWHKEASCFHFLNSLLTWTINSSSWSTSTSRTIKMAAGCCQYMEECNVCL